MKYSSLTDSPKKVYIYRPHVNFDVDFFNEALWEKLSHSAFCNVLNKLVALKTKMLEYLSKTFIK